jgi:hypothetical protein
MRDLINPWCSEGDFEHEIAYGHMGRAVTSRRHRKQAIALGILSMGRNVCFKKDSAPAPAPDPAIGQAAAANAQLGKEWLDYSKTRAAEGDKRQDVYDSLIGKVVDSQLSSQDQANAWAAQDREQGQAGKTAFDSLAGRADALGQKYESQLSGIADKFGKQADQQLAFGSSQQGRYSSTFAPIEDRIAKDAMTWDSDARLESEAGKSRADIVAGAEMAKQAQARQMASMGVNPNSGRFNATTRANELSTQLAAAGAENVTRDTVRNQAIQLRGQAAQVGQQVLGSGAAATGLGLQATQAQQNATQAAHGAASAGITLSGQLNATGLGAAGVGYQGLGVGLTAGSSAVGNQGAGNQSFIANNGIMNSGFAGGMQGYANQGNILNNLYGSQINAWGQQQQANAASSAGTGQMIGTAAGVAAAFMM